MLTNFHWNQSKNKRSAPIFVHFSSLMLIPARYGSGNDFCHKISNIRHCLQIMRTKFHEDRSKTTRSARNFPIFFTLTPISARCARGNHFCHRISYMRHNLLIMCTNFHVFLSKNARFARIFVHFCTFRADFCALRTRKSSFNYRQTWALIQRPYMPSFTNIGLILDQLDYSFLRKLQRMRPIPLVLYTNGLYL